MTKHYNPTIAQDAARILNSKQGDFLPDEVTGPVAVIPIERFCDIARGGASTSTGNITVYTTPAGEDFYLVGYSASYAKDATCDIATGRIQIATTIQGVSRDIGGFSVITTTSQYDSLSVTFDKPIKLDRAVTVVMSGTFTLGVLSRQISIFGFIVQTTK